MRLYLTGGATAVMEGWRASTIDVELRLEPESDDLLRRLAALKNQLDEQHRREERRGKAQRGPAGEGKRIVAPADVGDDEHVENHHRARVDHDLGGGDELGPEQQEQRREREQVGDQRQDAVERIAQHDHADRAGDRPKPGDEEEHLCHVRPENYSTATQGRVSRGPDNLR